MSAHKRSKKSRLARIKKRNARQPLTLMADEAVNGKVVTIPVSKLESLQIDQRYQRDEVRSFVDDLIRVLESGGQILEPIVVAVRPDGSRYIVDGQQRWWAHQIAEKSIRAMLVSVRDLEAERKLFLNLNNRRPVPARNKVKAWPGEGNALVEWINSSEESALRQDIDYGIGSRGKCPASTIAKTLLNVLDGLPSAQRIEDVMARLNDAVTYDKPLAYKRAKMLAVILSKVFQARIPSLAPRAIATVCRNRWEGLSSDDPFPMPSARQIQRLRKVNWTEYGNALQHLPVLIQATETRWPL